MSTMLQYVCTIHLISDVLVIVLVLQENQLQPPGKWQAVEGVQSFGPIKCWARVLGGCVLAVDPGVCFPVGVSHLGEIREKNIAFERLLSRYI